MTTKIPSASSVCVEYEWDLSFAKDVLPPKSSVATLVLSTFIGFPDVPDKAFRLCAGIKANGFLNRLRCYVNIEAMGRLGLRIRAVTCKMEVSGGKEHLVELTDQVGNDKPDCFLFSWDEPSSNAWPTLQTENSSLTFRLYVTGSVEPMVVGINRFRFSRLEMSTRPYCAMQAASY